jgi:hypothetical protein
MSRRILKEILSFKWVQKEVQKKELRGNVLPYLFTSLSAIRDPKSAIG